MFFSRFRRKDKARQRRRGPHGPSIISGEVVIEGHLISPGELQVNGTVNGGVRARAVIIDQNGVVQGEVAADEVIVRGRVIGPIRAIHVRIAASGHVEGDIVNETIAVENGAFIDGKIHRSDNPLGQDERDGYGHHQHGFGVVDEEGLRPVDPARYRGPKAAE